MSLPNPYTTIQKLKQRRLTENSKLLGDVAGIFAELGVSFQQAEEISEVLESFFLGQDDKEGWVDKASNATTGGECSC